METMNSSKSIAPKNIELIDLEKENTTSLGNVRETGTIDVKDENPRTATCRELKRGASPPTGILIHTGLNLHLKSFNQESRERTEVIPFEVRCKIVDNDQTYPKEIVKKPLKHQFQLLNLANKNRVKPSSPGRMMIDSLGSTQPAT